MFFPSDEKHFQSIMVLVKQNYYISDEQSVSRTLCLVINIIKNKKVECPLWTRETELYDIQQIAVPQHQ